MNGSFKYISETRRALESIFSKCLRSMATGLSTKLPTYCLQSQSINLMSKITKQSKGWGAVGLTENLSAFRKWMVSRPEQVRVLKEFEQSIY